jgi:hypothetical protein
MMGGFMNYTSKPLAAIAILFFSLQAVPGRAQSTAPAGTAAQAPGAAMIVARVNGTVSSSSLKVGGTLTAKTVKAFKLDNGADVPKGSKLIGTVVAARSKRDGGGDSLLAIRFDKAQVKGGGEVPIHGEVVAIGPNLGPKGDLGPHSVMGRNADYDGAPGSNTLSGLGKRGQMDEDDIPLGSTLEGVHLGVDKDEALTTVLQGTKRDVLLDSDVVIKLQLK